MKQLLSFFSLAALLVMSLGAAENKVPDISLDELKAAIAAKQVTLIDVNGSASFNQGHIPGAINFEANKENLATMLPADKNALIVAYCGNEHCSAYMRGAQAAIALGYTNVKHYRPGIAGWKEKNEPTEAAKG